MSKIIDFNKATIQSIVKKYFGFNKLEFEILISTIQSLYAYMEKVLEDPIDDIHPNALVYDLFEGDEESFMYSFIELLKYWELDVTNLKNNPLNKEFIKITVEDLCLFIEENAKN